MAILPHVFSTTFTSLGTGVDTTMTTNSKQNIIISIVSIFSVNLVVRNLVVEFNFLRVRDEGITYVGNFDSRWYSGE